MTILQSILPQFVNNFFDLLAVPFYTSAIIEFQYGWGIIHLLLALLLIYIIIKYKAKNPILLALLLLVAFEMFEFVISYIIPIINIELIQDTLGDLVIGFVAVLIGYMLFKQK